MYYVKYFFKIISKIVKNILKNIYKTVDNISKIVYNRITRLREHQNRKRTERLKVDNQATAERSGKRGNLHQYD